MKKIRVYSEARGLRVLKPEADLDAYLIKHNAVVVKCGPPSMATMERWMDKGSCRAIDGCSGIEPDGYCQHNKPSWLIALGLI